MRAYFTSLMSILYYETLSKSFTPVIIDFAMTAPPDHDALNL